MTNEELLEYIIDTCYVLTGKTYSYPLDDNTMSHIGTICTAAQEVLNNVKKD